MKLINNIDYMFRRALNTLDYRLLDHGEKVAFIVLKMLESENKYSKIQLIEAYYLSLFHDLGAYKTEDVDNLVNPNNLFGFEVKSMLQHSIYSYLFLKSFSFLQQYVDAVLFHHFTYPKLMQTNCQNKFLATKIFLADKIDILISQKKVSTVEDIFRFLQSPVFCREDVEMLKKLEKEQQVITKVLDYKYMEELLPFLNNKDLTQKQEKSLVAILPYTIDFRSESTVTHTIATVEITRELATLFNLSSEDKQNLFYGSLLHDIGKLSISLLILEKQDKLTDFEFSLMKDHVSLTEYILKGQVSEEIFNIAIKHHEKLDSTGYPHAIGAADLNLNERIVAVADIMSALMGKRSYKEIFPKEQVIGIIQKMATQNKICEKVVQVAIENYDVIEKSVIKVSDNALVRHKKLTEEYFSLLKEYESYF